MKIVPLNRADLSTLLELEKEMYFTSTGWARLWANEAKSKFKRFHEDYLFHFQEGGVGVVDQGKLVGAMWLLPVKKCQPIPYLHSVNEQYIKGGKYAYVSDFVVRKSYQEDEIAELLYTEAEIKAEKLGCKEIVVVIYRSKLEEATILSFGYQLVEGKHHWDIYNGMIVPCKLYTKRLDQ